MTHDVGSGETVDPDGPTQYAGVIEPETQSVYAWGLADVPDEPEPQRLTPRLITAGAVAASLALVSVAGVLAWQHLRAGEAPMAAPESMVPATITTTAEPVALPPKPPPAPPPVTVTTVVVQTPAPTPAQSPRMPTHSGITPEAMAAYDREFVARMQASNWRIDDQELMILRAHQVCEEYAMGSSPMTIRQKFVDLGATWQDAMVFTTNATATYPDCP